MILKLAIGVKWALVKRGRLPRKLKKAIKKLELSETLVSRSGKQAEVDLAIGGARGRKGKKAARLLQRVLQMNIERLQGAAGA